MERTLVQVQTCSLQLPTFSPLGILPRLAHAGISDLSNEQIKCLIMGGREQRRWKGRCRISLLAPLKSITYIGSYLFCLKVRPSWNWSHEYLETHWAICQMETKELNVWSHELTELCVGNDMPSANLHNLRYSFKTNFYFLD